jgi:hypothetical protein
MRRYWGVEVYSTIPDPFDRRIGMRVFLLNDAVSPELLEEFDFILLRVKEGGTR